MLNEFLMKLQPQTSVHVQNMNLYAASCLIYMLAYIVRDLKTGLEGFTTSVWLLVAVNIARGLGISLVFKNNTNLTKVFIVSVSTILQGALGWLFLAREITMTFVLAVLLISAAMYLYASQKSDEVTFSPSGLYATVDEDIELVLEDRKNQLDS